MLTKHYTAWIDVDDLLPFEDGDYLVAYKRGDIHVGCFIAFYSTGRPGWVMDESIVTHEGIVTHWMAMPSPPREPIITTGKCRTCWQDIDLQPDGTWQHRGGQSFFIDSYPVHDVQPR